MPLHPGSITLLGGGSTSWIDGTGDARYWFDPYSTAESAVAPSAAVEVRFPLKFNFNAMAGVGYREKGQTVPKTQVMFAGDPYPHDLEIKTSVQTLTVPLALEWQLDAGPVWLAIKGGAFGDVFLSQKMAWYIDGEADNGRNVPSAKKKKGDMGVLGGADLGVRIQQIGLLVGANYEYSLSGVTEFPDYYYSSYTSMPNSSALRAVEIHAGVRWFLPR